MRLVIWMSSFHAAFLMIFQDAKSSVFFANLLLLAYFANLFAPILSAWSLQRRHLSVLMHLLNVTIMTYLLIAHLES